MCDTRTSSRNIICKSVMKLPISVMVILTLSVRYAFSTPVDFNRYFVEAAQKARPSVVNIVIYQKQKKEKDYKRTAFASGTIISKKGYIVTNYHVVSKGNFFRVKLHNGQSYELSRFKNGKFYLADPKTDIALMKFSGPDEINVTPIEFADSSVLRQGEWVMAVGNPYGLSLSVTSGIVSSSGRDNLGFADIEDFIQSDVPINPGNSGGPLVNLQGTLVGINTAIRTVSGGFQGISFAIPSNIVKQVCDELIQHGRVRRGWFGFLVREKPDNAVRENSRVEVLSVIKNSPAEKAGIIKGDIIREFDNKKIDSIGSLLRIAGSVPVGSTVPAIISRDGRLHRLSLYIMEKKQYKKIRKARDDLFKRYGIEIDKNANNNDVVISYVSPRSMSYGLSPGDIIIRINGKKIFSIEDFFKLYYDNNGTIEVIQVYRDPDMYSIDMKDN